MSWWWRTKPRSILRTIQWFPYFGKLDGKDWNYEDPVNKSYIKNQTIHPTRREYIYNAHSEEDEHMSSISFSKYLSGNYDVKETESNGRNDKITYEFFGLGYLDNGIIKVTDVGRRILEGKFDAEDFLKQLLKLQFPNVISSNPKGFLKDDYIYPLEIIIRTIDKFGYLNRSELALIFGCTNNNKINDVFKAIGYFRTKYNELENKNETIKVKQIFEEAYCKSYGAMDNKVGSYYDYAEALSRCLVYTGLFSSSGRSLATKLKVPEYSKIKFKMLVSKFVFEKKDFSSISNYMDWFGNCDSIKLPWDNDEARKQIIEEKITYIESLKSKSEFITKYGGDISDAADEVISSAKENAESQLLSYTALKDSEKQLVNFITKINEEKFIKELAQTKQAREEILQKFDEIIDTIDMGALWLEVNTWKSLLAIKGNKIVKRNFNIEEDLTPKSFAPGIGNTPDMEMYVNNHIIIPEVSLMTGTQQWEHEASSVINHVLSFIKDYKDKNVLGLFISTSINIRTKWQFFILNKESWMESPVPVVPLTIKQYKEIIEAIYDYEKDISCLVTLIENVHDLAVEAKDYNEWFISTNVCINNWKSQLIISA